MNERSPRQEPAPEDRRYNGWANYPTWAANLWLSNDEASYHAAEGIVEQAGNAYRGAEEIKAWVIDNSPLGEDASMYADILGWALQIVDWNAVAQAFAPEDWTEPGNSPDDPTL